MIQLPVHDMEITCPYCGESHDAVTAAQNKVFYPEDGDVSLCFDCGKFSVFDSKCDGGVRKPTADERRQLDADQGLQTVLSTWKILKRGRAG